MEHLVEDLQPPEESKTSSPSISASSLAFHKQGLFGEKEEPEPPKPAVSPFVVADDQSLEAVKKKLATLWTETGTRLDPTQPVLELRNINKSFFGEVTTQVLFDINLKVMPGEFVAIVGSSGSGKTTLLNLMGLLDTPTSGEVFLGGRDVASLVEDERAIMRRDFLGFIFQFHYLLPEYNVLENVLMPCRLRGREFEQSNRERMTELLGLIGLKERVNHRPSQLSGGQQQRVAILRALANDPVLVLADEPTGNLDSKSGEIVFNLMRELNVTTQKAFLMVTHDNDFAERADRLIRLVDGRVVDDIRRR
ncbi:MAG: ABC transporter ATP-binding protein [Myxococcales bacterium]|nr:ABC transporter ATP-binding protein [Myxococcales bacterium]